MIMKNKRGIVLGEIFIFLVIAFVFIMILGSFLYIYGTVNTSLTGRDIQAGQVNLTNASINTIGKINTGLINSVDLIGLLVLFGMVIAMVVNGFVNRDRNPKVFLVVDFLIMLFAYILAVYIANSFETVLNALPFQNLMIENMSGSIRFMLLLPKITLITGILTLIVTYAGIPKTKEEEVAGF